MNSHRSSVRPACHFRTPAVIAPFSKALAPEESTSCSFIQYFGLLRSHLTFCMCLARTVLVVVPHPHNQISLLNRTETLDLEGLEWRQEILWSSCVSQWSECKQRRRRVLAHCERVVEMSAPTLVVTAIWLLTLVTLGI